MSSGTSALVRCTCSATGRILSSANRRNVSPTNSKSASRWVGPVPCLAHSSARDSRNAGARCAATKSCAGASTAGSTPHSCSRPMSRATMSLTASATNARASIDSISPCSAYRFITRPASTAAAAWARSYAITWLSSSLATDNLPSARLAWARLDTAVSTTEAARSIATPAASSWLLMRLRPPALERPRDLPGRSGRLAAHAAARYRRFARPVACART